MQEVVAAIDQCMHWPGEEPYDEERKKLLVESIQRDCPKAVELARQTYGELTASAAGALSLVTLTAHFGSEYGANEVFPPGDLRRVCGKALEEVQRLRAADASESFPYFEQTCSRFLE